MSDRETPGQQPTWTLVVRNEDEERFEQDLADLIDDAGSYLVSVHYAPLVLGRDRILFTALLIGRKDPGKDYDG